MSILDFFFPFRRKLKPIERHVLEKTIECAPAYHKEILRRQVEHLINNIKKIYRCPPWGMEVNFWVHNKESLVLFQTRKIEAKLSRVFLRDTVSGHQATATITLVRGRIFAITFNAPPGDLDIESIESSAKYLLKDKDLLDSHSSDDGDEQCPEAKDGGDK